MERSGSRREVTVGLKKNKKSREEDLPSRAKGNARAVLVLELVATDSTFFIMKFPPRMSHGRDPEKWIGKCIHCNTSLSVSLEGKTDATIEHIMPLVAGGTCDLQNMALACSRCNNMKGIHHDAKRLDGRAQEVVDALLLKRAKRWRVAC